MIAKKNPKVDLEGKRAAIFNVGLLVAGSFTLAAFTYTETTTTEAEKMAVAVEEIVTFEVEDKKVEDKPEIEKPEQPQNQDQNQEQPENLGSQTGLAENVAETKNGSEGLKQPDGPGGAFGVPYKKPTFKPIDGIVIPDIDAAYVGGILEMKNKIASVQQYPDIDRVMGNQGTVYVSFVVEKDGSITDVKSIRGVSETLDREAVRIVKSFPKWIPGKNEYGVVRTRVRLPITFLLE